MRTIRAFLIRLGSLFSKERRDREFADELESHLAMHVEDNLRAGMTLEEAQRQARMQLGGLEAVKESYRDRRGLPFLETLWQDLRYGIRVLRRSPSVTLVAVLSLALGIGANTAVFTLMNTVMLRSLPVHNPEEIWRLNRLHADGRLGSFSYPLFRQIEAANAASAELFATNFPSSTNVQISNRPSFSGSEIERVSREVVTSNYFQALGVGAALGRTIFPEDDHLPDGNHVAVISHRYWKRRFGMNPSVLGATLLFGETSYTVIGVAAPEFFGVEVGNATDVWVPVTTLPTKNWLVSDGFNFLRILGRLHLLGRLHPGSTANQVAAAAQVVLMRQVSQNIDRVQNAKLRQSLLAQRVLAEPAANGFSRLREQFSEPLRVLLVIVSLVLLIACGNIANLQLAKAAARQREIAVRMAIGAGRRRLIRQLLTESILVAIFGGALGVIFAYWGCQSLLRFVPKGAFPLVLDLRPDWRVLMFTFALSLAAGILSGLAPALRAAGSGLDAALKSRSSGRTRSRTILGRVLMAAQIALSVLLLIGSGLFIRTLMNLQAVDLGFDRDHLLTFGINLPRGLTEPQARELLLQAVERAEAIPGVRGASFSWPAAFSSGGWTTTFRAPGYVLAPDESEQTDASRAGPRYFETMGIPILAGRDFTIRDGMSGSNVVIVSQALARHYFADQNPLGRRVHYETQSGGVDAEIIGVAGDIRRVREQPRRTFYIPALQSGGPASISLFEVHSIGDPAPLMSVLRREMEMSGGSLRIADASTIREQVNESIARERLVATISGFFALIAIVLGCIGIYGVTAYGVEQRTNEVGIRMTLGARRGEVIWMILREALLLVSAGIILGGAAAFGMTRLVKSLLFGLEPADPGVTVTVALTMICVALLAGYLPARRAASIDPMAALRCD